MTKFYPKLLGACLALLLSGFGWQTSQAATINVTETGDGFDGDVCTLRNAIQSVNQGGDFGGCVNSSPDGYGVNDTITLIGDTYVLSLDGSGEHDNEFGDLDIHTSVTIVGAGADQTAISGSGFTEGEEDRVIHIVEVFNGEGGFTPSITVNIQDLTIRDGRTRNFADSSGAGLLVEFSEAEVHLTNVVVTENHAIGDGGGIANFNALLRMDHCVVSDNVAEDDGGGLQVGEGVAMIFNSTIDGNFAPESGGGIASFGALILANSTVSRNQSFEEFVNGISGSGAQLFGEGGGINIEGGVFLALNSTISNNAAGLLGGGINARSSLDSFGADDPLNEFPFILLNVTIAENTVLSPGGFGGGICFDCQIFPQGESFDEFAVFNTLVANNEAPTSPDCGGDFFSGGFNLIGNPQACNGFTATGDQTNVADPGIGPLQNNGGPTETHALLEGSPAIDRANDEEGCIGIDTDLEVLFNSGLVRVPLTEDQRGFIRPVAILDPDVPVCDIGAYEFQIAEPTPTPTPTATPLPPFNAFLQGSGCSLSEASSASATGLLWIGLALVAGFYGLRKSRAQG